MFMPKLPLVSLLLLLAAALALPSFADTVSAPSAEQIVAARQASLDMSVITFSGMQNAMKNGDEAKKVSYFAKALARWAKVLPTLFPPGTGAGQQPLPTAALPDVWSNRAEFEQRAADYAAATDKLSALAQANDTAGFTAQLPEVKKACDACHKDFKQRD
jgi:cytochrome c556